MGNNSFIKRIPEPEKMTQSEELCYSQANYSAFNMPHEKLVNDVINSVGDYNSSIKLVDIGCGPGDILIRIRKRKSNWHLYGLDLSNKMLEYAQAFEKKEFNDSIIKWIQADAKETNLPSSNFDAVISNSVLHHMGNTYMFWNEIQRIGKPGAMALVRDLIRPADDQTALEIMQKHVSNEPEVVQKHYYSSLHSAFNIEEVQEQLKKVGLIDFKITKLEDRYINIFGHLPL